jgi:hypothetical protein
MKNFSDFLDERCWPGYKPKLGKQPYSSGSCVKEEDMKEDWSQKYKSDIDCDNPKGFSQKAHCAGKKKNESVNEDLRNWFSKTSPKGDWKRINSKGEAIGPCAREPGEPKPKCMSQAQRASLSKKERASAVRRKRQQDPDAERQGAPINVKSKVNENMEQLDEKNKPTNPELWSRAIAQAKSKFDVYPSAYANGWASKWYKERGGEWKSVAEAMEVGDDPINQGTPEGIGRRGPKTVLKKFKELSSQIKEAKEKTEYDYEGDMARGQLQSIINNAQKVHDMLEDNDNLPEWVQSKITLSEDYISTVANYMMSEIDEEVELDEGLQQTLRKYVPGYAKAQLNKKMNAQNYASGDSIKKTVDKDVNYNRYKKVADKLNKEEVVQEGRPSQQHPLEGHEYHRKTNAELEYIAKDAHKAAEAMKSHNTTAENKYRDQASDSATVRHFRKTSGTPDWYKKKYGHMKEAFKPMDEPNYNNSIQARQKKADDNKPPFEGPYKKAQVVVTDKSGAKHGSMSRARDLAKQAAKKQAGSMKEEKQKSRKAQIIKNASKGNDKFEKDPIITDTTSKTDNLQ